MNDPPLQRICTTTTLLQRSWTLQRLPLGYCNAPAARQDAATAASVATLRSCNAPRRCNWCFWAHATRLQRSWALQLLLRGPRNAPATLPEDATASSGATQRSCNAPGRCNCFFCGHATLPPAAPLDVATVLLWGHAIVASGPRNAAATLQDTETAASAATRRS